MRMSQAFSMIRAKKSLGQNFLTDPRVAEAMADAGKVVRGDLVLEVGPGTGMLTRVLLARGARVIAVEKDARALPILEAAFPEEVRAKRLTLVSGDILEESVATLGIRGAYKVVANIPYYITGSIMRSIFSQKRLPETVALLVQKEVAERAVAREGKESVLSLSLKAYGTPRLIRTVPRGAFSPVPGVDSAILAVEDISSSSVKGREEQYFALVKAGFSEKRKRLAKNLEKVAPRDAISYAFSELQVDTDARAEDVPPPTWLALAKLLAKEVHTSA